MYDYINTPGLIQLWIVGRHTFNGRKQKHMHNRGTIGTVPANLFLFAGSVPENSVLFAGSVSVNKLE